MNYAMIDNGNVKILIVDDRPENLLALESILDNQGYTLVRANSGRDALRHLLAEDFAVILLDVQMPEMDGFETAAMIKERELTRHIPIIFLTAIEKSEAYAYKGYMSGAVDYIFKPFVPAILKAKVRVFADLYRMRTEMKRQLQEIRALDGQLRETNRQLEVERNHAETANKAKSDFLANMSHELRTPLNSIIGFADILEQGFLGELTPEQAGCVRDISCSGRHLLSLINDILDLSKVEAGKMEPEPEDVDIGVLARESLNFFKEKALKHCLDLSTEIAEGTGGVVADVRMMKQVIINLLSNAVKFTPDGGRIQVRARRVKGPPHPALSPQDGARDGNFQSPRDGARDVRDNFLAPAGGGEEEGEGAAPGGEFIEVAVEDTGIGIAPEDQQKLFQPFQQIRTALTTKCAGTGLGLSLCKRFVELHGGSIRVASEPGQGSTFTFRLPVKQSLEGTSR